MYEWMTAIVEQGAEKLPFPDSEKWPVREEGTKQGLFERLSAQNAVGEMIVKLGRQLSGIVRGEIQPLQVMMENDVLHRYYRCSRTALFNTFEMLSGSMRRSTREQRQVIRPSSS